MTQHADSPGKRVLVCGGRKFGDRKLVDMHLGGIHAGLHSNMRWNGPISFLIHGGAGGADALALGWASANRIPNRKFDARWNDIAAPGAIVKYRRDGSAYNAAAGPQRNQRMLDEGKPDLVIAFPGGNGTADMIRRAQAAGVETVVVVVA